MTAAAAAPGRARVTRVGVAFLLNGVAATVWLAATPALTARLGTTAGSFGAAFVAMALGGIVGTRAAPLAIRRVGSGRTTAIAGFAIAAGLAVRAAPHSLGWFVVAQLAAGFADGVHDVAMNVEAVAVDARTRMPVVNRLHAVWSIGAVVGGLLGAALAVAGAPVPLYMFIGAAAVALLSVGTLPLFRSRVAPPPAVPAPAAGKWWHSRALVALAVMGVAASVLEGAPLDWGALYLTDELDTSSGIAAAATVTFTAGMVVARLAGDHLVQRFGVPAVLRTGAAAAGVALVTALVADHPVVVLIAWAIIGGGVAASYPALFVAAGRAPGLAPGAGIGAVSSVARTGFLLGPAVIGWLANRYGLRIALVVPVLAALFIVVLADAARRPPPPDSARE